MSFQEWEKCLTVLLGAGGNPSLCICGVDGTGIRCTVQTVGCKSLRPLVNISYTIHQLVWTQCVCVKPDESCYPSMIWQRSKELLVMSQNASLSQSSTASVNDQWGRGGRVMVVSWSSFGVCFGSLSLCSMNRSPQRRKPEGAAYLWKMECYFFWSGWNRFSAGIQLQSQQNNPRLEHPPPHAMLHCWFDILWYHSLSPAPRYSPVHLKCLALFPLLVLWDEYILPTGLLLIGVLLFLIFENARPVMKFDVLICCCGLFWSAWSCFGYYTPIL